MISAGLHRTLRSRTLLRWCAVMLAALGVVRSCAFDGALREYLRVHFWMPFNKDVRSLAKAPKRESISPYAGLSRPDGDTALARLRAAYQTIAFPDPYGDPIPLPGAEKFEQAVAAARGAAGLTQQEREEIELIDAKIAMRLAERGEPAGLNPARSKMLQFLKTARTPEFASEARGWLARIYHLQGDSAKATKIYLDELHRKNSNLSTEVLITSLKLVHGQRGSRDLMKHLEEYFDTPQHAAFAIHTLTNPIRIWAGDRGAEPEDEPLPHARILKILEKHRHLFRSDAGSRLLALMSMRVALRGGDPKGALQIASHVPGTASIRKDPDFQWMLGSSYFLSRDYAGAEQPLLALHGNPNATPDQRAAAAYGLCGVYQKTRNPVEQLRFALWLTDRAKRGGSYRGAPSRNVDFSIYWAPSGWDLALLLDTELSIDDLRAFLDRYPTVPEVRMVKYGLAVRLARVDQYEESARVYESIGVRTRAQRMRVLSKLHREASNSEDPAAANQAKYRMAQFLEGNSERIYFNDMLWTGLQRYAFGAEEDPHFTRDERELAIENERRLQDEQEERWRAYHLLKEIVETSKDAALRRKSAELSLRCLRRIATDRFGREEEVRAADIAMSRWLHRQSGTLR